jgi:hypothetical protein
LVYIKQAFVVLFSFVGEILVSIMSNKSRPNYSASFQQQSDGFDEELELAANPESGSVTLVDEGRRGKKYIVALLAAVVVSGVAVFSTNSHLLGNAASKLLETTTMTTAPVVVRGPPTSGTTTTSTVTTTTSSLFPSSTTTMTGITTGTTATVGVTTTVTTSTKSPTFEPTKAPAAPSFPPTLAPTVAASTGVRFTTYRDGYPTLAYFDENPSSFLKYKILEGHSGVVEPNADMYFHLSDESTGEERRLKEEAYTFEMCPNDDSGCLEVKYGDSFNLACTPRTTVYSVTVNEKVDDEWTAVGTGYLKCMYVRRELRSLTQKDLQATVSAMYKMWELEEEEGQAKYGENFHNYARLLEYHYFNAAWQDADHVHEGNGFLPQHMKMDLIFSKSLTAIDPSISLMYWDFTM